MCDQDRIREVVNNLLDNAIKYTEKGLIDVRTELEGSDVKVRCGTTGSGSGRRIGRSSSRVS
jgi:signal transduction histidine kinase